MIETLAIIILGGLFLYFFRQGKMSPQKNRLLINRPGKYQISLAPQLNLAQPFIEAIAKRIELIALAMNSSAKLFFTVQDRRVIAHGADSYLLAIVYRNGMLYFQAEYPSRNPDNNLDMIQAFTIDALLAFPARNEQSEALEVDIVSAIQTVALDIGVNVHLLTE